MKTVLATLTMAMVSVAAPAMDERSALDSPVGCIDAETLWNLLAAWEHHDAMTSAQLMAVRCQSLANTRYLLVEQRNGVSKLRVFKKPDEWATSWVAYTLDEMVAPEQELRSKEPDAVPTGSSS
jgi:hypothetical protein